MTRFCIRFYAAAASVFDDIEADTPRTAMTLARRRVEDGSGRLTSPFIARPAPVSEISVCDAEGFELAHWHGDDSAVLPPAHEGLALR